VRRPETRLGEAPVIPKPQRADDEGADGVADDVADDRADEGGTDVKDGQLPPFSVVRISWAMVVSRTSDS
jgi:hypothetical protein